MPSPRPPRPSLPEAARLFRALGHATRLRLLLCLADRGELPAGALGKTSRRSRSNTSKRLLLLRLSGVVASRRAGRHVYYRLHSPFVAVLLRQVCEG